MMNRRQFLASLVTMPIAASWINVTPMLEPVERVLIPSVPLDGWRIHFPDGTIYSFSGVVTSMKRVAPVDALITDTFTIRPTGPATVEYVERYGTQATTISRNGEDVGIITDVEVPTMHVNVEDITTQSSTERNAMPGLWRLSDMKFTVMLDTEKL